MRTAVVILGYNVDEPNHEHVVWGEPPDRAGRLVKGAAEALAENADVVFITGCGEMNGKEGVEIMRDRLYAGLNDLKDFKVYPIFQHYSVISIRERLERAMRLEYRRASERLQTTSRTMANIAETLLGERIQKVILVSSPDHVCRCLRDAFIYWQEKYPSLIVNLSATPCVTFYSARKPADEEIAKMENVVIFEPPFYKSVGKRAQELFKFRDKEEVLSKIDQILDKGV